MDIVNKLSEAQMEHQIFRITDIDKEPLDILPPISGYEYVELVSLETAVEPLIPFLPDIHIYASIAIERCRKRPVDRLSNDESASIMLYTMGWEPLDQCLYVALNKTLRSNERSELEPWFLYLRLFLIALSRLPSIDQNIYRRVNLDLSQQYKKGETIIWWGFSSCATSMNVLESKQSLKGTDTRTLFTIKCTTGKNIRQHSYFQLEDEILLFPLTQFKVQNCSSEKNNIHSIRLEETSPISPLSYPKLLSSQSNNSFSKKELYVSNYEFSGISSTTELRCHENDTLEILDRYSYNQWWEAKNLRTKKTGYVRAILISALVDLTDYEWYFTKTIRRDAERLLEQVHNGKGTFIIRSSDTNEVEESMSVLNFNQDKHFHVKHYRIRRTDQGLFYINIQQIFSSLPNLVNHYQRKIDGLCCLLTYPCRKIDSLIHQDGLPELDRSHCSYTESIHQGEYGQIDKGTYGQRDIAIVYIKTDKNINSSDIKKLLDQAKIMKNLSHENLIDLYGVSTKEEPILFITEPLTHGCLLKYLRQQSAEEFQLKTILQFAMQIIKAMIYLGEEEYVHCDLAARNIFLGDLNMIKIGGFSLTETLQKGRVRIDKQSQYSIKWIAPEVIKEKIETIKSDVWSFGILLYELITHGSSPYPQFSDEEVLQSISNGYRMPKPNDCPKQYYQIMQSCWEENPDHRPTFQTLFTRFDQFIIEDESIS